MDQWFAESNRSVIIVDEEAIPMTEYGGGQETQPSKQFLEDLEEITLDNRNIVVIFSNQSVEVLESHFLGLDDLWLAPESGYMYRTGAVPYQKLITMANNGVWIHTVREVMQPFVNNVDGSVVEEREGSVIWNYRNSEEEQGQIIVKELYNQLKQALGNCPLEIVQGKGYLEVKPLKLKKHKLVKVLLEKVGIKVDLLLYIGAENTGNEKVYQYLTSKKSDAYFSREHHKYICSLRTHSSAIYSLSDLDEVRFLFNRMRTAT